MTSCAVCGRVGDPATVALAWSTTLEQRRTLLVCEACTREHVRSMEAKLDPQHW